MNSTFSAAPSSKVPYGFSDPDPILLQKIKITDEHIIIKTEDHTFEFELDDVHYKKQKKTVLGAPSWDGFNTHITVSVDQTLFREYYEIVVEKSYSHPNSEAAPQKYQTLSFRMES